MRRFRHYTVSPEAARRGFRLGLPGPVEDNLAKMAAASVPTRLGDGYIRCGVFLLSVKEGEVMSVSLVPWDWIRPELKPVTKEVQEET